MGRPIGRDKVDWLDRTYPYGWNQYGGRPVHLGVDFANPRFTPVLAAGDGTIIYAGSDAGILFGPSNNYYGNLVVIEHGFKSPDGLPVYTLYGHLQRTEVERGQSIKQGDVVGVIGDAGVALGPHLHFEVRIGDAYDYKATRNPDLWIFPYPNFGTLAGRAVNSNGALEYGLTIQVRSAEETLYAFTYADDSVYRDSAWRENFTRGDLPEGEYEVIVSESSGRVRFRQNVMIEGGKTTWVDVVVN
jgi:murein DD-endopeptidase MepM/ murein hydrolase activator NlpD